MNKDVESKTSVIYEYLPTAIRDRVAVCGPSTRWTRRRWLSTAGQRHDEAKRSDTRRHCAATVAAAAAAATSLIGISMREPFTAFVVRPTVFLTEPNL